MAIAQSQPPVFWKQVLGLAAVQAAISLMWVMYGLYLPELLSQFGMSPQTALALLIVENGLAIALEPLMGGLSDQVQYWVGTRFPVIVVGVAIASGLFLLIPTLAILGSPGAAMRVVVVVVLVAWAIAMTIFHSPVLSLLRRYSTVSHLPIAMSLLTLASGLIGTAKGLVTEMILSFGPAVTFAVGSFTLLGATAALRAVDPASPPASSSQPTESQTLPVSRLGLIAIIGFAVGWGNRLILDNLVKAFQIHYPDDVGGLMLAIALGLAILALPAGMVATHFSNRRVLCAGLLLSSGFAAIVTLSTSLILMGATIALMLCLSLVLNSTIPFALSLVPSNKAGLSTGMYTGGLAASVSFFAFLYRQPEQITPGFGALMVAIAFLAAACCIFIGRPETIPQSVKP
jgi:MFS family permease